MWDDDLETPPSVATSTTNSSSARIQDGICVGRGRGFGNLADLKSALPQPGSHAAAKSTVDDSGWQEDDSGWDESGSAATSNMNGAWQDSNDSWGGGAKKFNRNDDFGSGSGNRSRGCFKCGDEGHMSRDCPEGGSRGGGGSRACHKCGEEGHMARECPSGGGGGRSGGRACHKCGEEGHMARECPSGGSGRACHKCGEEGHMARDCTSGGGGGGRTCHKCGEEGHMARDCPSGGSGGGGGGRSCHKCGEEGHMARDCPSAGGDGSRSKGCHRCGEEGHFVKDCPNPDTRSVGPDGKPRAPLYIPPELPDDANSIFETVPTGINFSKYDSIPVDVSGRNVPPPTRSFDSANLSQHLIGNIKRSGYEVPTPVQKHAIPIIMQKRDLMACAETGSGKTAAFLLPIINNMITDAQLPNNANNDEQEPLAVILSPTRELAIQIMSEARKFAYDSVIKAEVVYGGTSTAHQTSRIRRGVHILVATPGRLLDFVEKGKVTLAKLKYFVLDEADRMLDMGFMPAVEKMVNLMPPKGVRQTLMFSATFAEEIQRLAAKFLEDYLFLTVGTVGGANSDVEQTFFKVGQYEKRQKLMDILKESGTNRVLVFVEQKRTADFLASYTSQQNIPTTSIHGDRLQKEREEALRDFRTGRMPVLVATAVAARGLDIKDVCHVINYDLPQSIDEYVHRIGRTGRVGNLGKATSFYDPDVDQGLARSLKKILMDAKQVIPDWLHEEADHAVGTAPQYSRGNFGGRDVRKQPRNQSSDAWENDFSGGNESSYSQPIETDEVWD